MSEYKYCHIWLTCKDRDEADKISKILLNKHYIACAKKICVESDFLWHGEVDHNTEVLIIMESREDLFEKIEVEVAKIHSYDTFVLQALPLLKISEKAKAWLGEEIG